jgi:hypothetical protein
MIYRRPWRVRWVGKGKMTDGTHFLLDVLADLIVNLQFLLKFIKLFFTNFPRLDCLLTRGNRR